MTERASAERGRPSRYSETGTKRQDRGEKITKVKEGPDSHTAQQLVTRITEVEGNRKPVAYRVQAQHHNRH